MKIDFVTVAFRNDPTDLVDLMVGLVEGAAKAGVEAEVQLVINDDSADAIPEAIEHTRIHFGHGNVGFAAGITIGTRAGTGDYIIYVNPDCIADADSVASFIRMIHPSGISVPRLLNAEGEVDHYAYENWTFSPGRKLSEWQCRRFFRKLTSDALPEFAKAPGAFLGMPRDVAEKLASPFDSSFFLYAEDRDMTDRARNLGIPVQLVRVDISHIGGVSGVGINPMVQFCKVDGSLRVAHRRFGRLGALLYSLDVRLIRLLKRQSDNNATTRAVRRWSASGYSDPGRIRDEEFLWAK